jgi:glycerol-3-phosphate dehydrogenase (NAD+)
LAYTNWLANAALVYCIFWILRHCYFFFVSGMVAALTNESATSKSVYFAHCTSEMIFITHLLTEQPEKLAGPLLADTYVTLLKGRNAWYGQMLAKGELSPDMGDSIKGKGMIQVIS